MNNWINRDETVLLQAYEEIAAVLNQSRRGFVERIRDAHSKRTMNVIDSCCEKVHESIANMSCLVTFAKFAREMTDGKENNTVYKSIQELDAKTFWIHSFGPHCLKIDIDTFATKYHQYLIKTHLWKEGNVPVTEDTVRRIVKNIIDTSEGQADVISLVEFNAFNQRFRPMNKSFIKMACLCQEDGELQPWFLPVRTLQKAAGWMLRLASQVDNGFTLEICTPTSKFGKRIDVQKNGKYTLPTDPRKTEYETLVELLRVEVDSFYAQPDVRSAVKPRNDYFSECLAHWVEITQKSAQLEDSSLYITRSISPSFSNVPSSAVIGPDEVLRRLNQLEWKLQTIVDFIANKKISSN
eukprot:TRINITY_DN5348_c0_g1_i6.p1 TRINITY_DN5348_c0_g1~~TRINITY_DN5348_c0_g1_i6.p1  ORF type:complete len:398 (-),score=90.41 TRINITY_DN5348_c0_g1_i6:914-1972(-)